MVTAYVKAAMMPRLLISPRVIRILQPPSAAISRTPPLDIYLSTCAIAGMRLERGGKVNTRVITTLPGRPLDANPVGDGRSFDRDITTVPGTPTEM